MDFFGIVAGMAIFCFWLSPRTAAEWVADFTKAYRTAMDNREKED